MLLAKSNNIIVRRNSNNGACKNLSFFRSHNAHMFHPPFRLYPRYYSTAQHKNQVGSNYFFDFFGTHQRQQSSRFYPALKPLRHGNVVPPLLRGEALTHPPQAFPLPYKGRQQKGSPDRGAGFALAKRLRGLSVLHRKHKPYFCRRVSGRKV